MIIGVPKEIKNNENRVGMTPAGVAELVKRGHTVYVQASAGANSGFSDDDYIAVGAQMLPTIEDTYAIADMIVKVKEPIAPEYKLIKKEQVVFTYFHFAADKLLTEAMIASGAVCIAYETVEKEDRSLPLLTPMSEVAGRMATQVGARFLEKPQGGKGKLMGGVTGVRPARVLILGGGIVGTNAAQIAAGMGAEVLIADINLPRLRYLSEVMPKNVKTLYSSLHNIKSPDNSRDDNKPGKQRNKGIADIYPPCIRLQISVFIHTRAKSCKDTPSNTNRETYLHTCICELLHSEFTEIRHKIIFQSIHSSRHND